MYLSLILLFQWRNSRGRRGAERPPRGQREILGTEKRKKKEEREKRRERRRKGRKEGKKKRRRGKGKKGEGKYEK